MYLRHLLVVLTHVYVIIAICHLYMISKILLLYKNFWYSIWELRRYSLLYYGLLLSLRHANLKILSHTTFYAGIICLMMLQVTYYAKNYAGIISQGFALFNA